jgi:hypothetical protein
MKLATFNVNGVNGRLPVLLRWLDEAAPDIVCLQGLSGAARHNCGHRPGEWSGDCRRVRSERDGALVNSLWALVCLLARRYGHCEQ